ERARPRSLEMIRPHVAAREDFQRGKKLLAEEVAPATDAGERCRRTDHRAAADLRAVVGLDAPDGGDDVAVDPVGLLDRVEDGAIAGENRAAILDAILVHE